MVAQPIAPDEAPAEIQDEQLLFGPPGTGLGLYSVDRADKPGGGLDKSFGLKITHPAAAKDILHSVKYHSRRRSNKNRDRGRA